MNVNFSYNWPPGNKFVRTSFGMPNIEDKNFQFRIGVIKKADQAKVYWQDRNEWTSHDQIEKITFDVERGDKVVVDKKKLESGEIVLKHLWDTEKDWPAEAHGAAMTVVPYYF